MAWVEKTTLDGFLYWYDKDNDVLSWHKPEQLMSPEEIEENKGEWVWTAHPTDVWQEAKVEKRDDDGTAHLRLRDGTLMKVAPDRVVQGKMTNGRKQVVPLWELKKSNLRFLEDDLVMLDPVNEAFIIRNLAQRYANKDIYTWVGAGNTVLVSVNPYQDLGLYGQDQIELHRNKPPNKAIPPHVFDIANDSYHSMVTLLSNQSILISGESGAGKTEATKQCLKYLASIAGSGENNVEDKVLVANPLLEAFGNAKTIRNINSSRFGKWMEVYFNRKTSKVQGSKIVNYLLERSRVVHQQKDERNFHIFYELCFDEESKTKFNLTEPADYRYLAQSGCVKVPQIDDVADFKAVKNAMNLLEFSKEEQESILQLTAGVLWLGNLEFAGNEQKGGVTGSELKPGAALGMISKLLQIKEEELSTILCFRSIRPRAGKETTKIPLALEKARIACDSLAMGIYGKLFNWMVKRVNGALGEQEGRFIGLLDVFGFEIFAVNSFEQLCINYANEKLQALFCRTTFKEEEDLYKRENVAYTPIQFIDNQPVLDLVEQKPKGILPALDDECLVPKGSSEGFMGKIDSYHSASGILQVDDKRRFKNSLSFEIKHYAGVVKYDATLFITKNKDTVFEDMYNAVNKSDNKLLKEIFEDSNQRIKTVSFQFRGQLNTLMKTLNDTESRFIRCIKPNEELSPNMFVASNCIEQLTYAGVFEAVNIRKTGYPFRYTHIRFIYRFGCINFGYKYKTPETDEIARIKEIFKVSKQDFSGCKIGESMVLYKANEYKLLKLLRNLSLEKIIPILQAVLKGGNARKYFSVLKLKHRNLQKYLRKANDYEGLTKAIKDCALQESFSKIQIKMFGHVVPYLALAAKLRDDLKLWLDLQAKMLTLKEKCEKEKPDKYYETLKRIEKEFEDLEQTQKFKVAEAHVDFYQQRMYIAPKISRVQRDLLKDVKEFIRLCVLGILDERVTKAVANKDRAEIVASLEQADELKHVTPKIKEARVWLAKFEELDEECKNAVKCVSKTMLLAALEKAKEYGQSNDLIQEAQKMADLKEKPFVELEYARAKEVNDKERMIHREIRLLTFKYDDIDINTVNVERLANYRTEVDYVKGKMFGAAALKTNMKRYTVTPIPSSLTIPSFETKTLEEGHVVTPQEKQTIKDFKKRAKDNFNNILMYMGDKKAKIEERMQAAQQILQRGLSSYTQKDDDFLMEMYVQVIKQLTGNETATSEMMDPRASPDAVSSYHNGLALLAMMLSVFPPCTKPYEISANSPATFDDAVVVWIMNNVLTEDRKRYLSALHNSKYGPPAANAPDAGVVKNQFAEMKGVYALDDTKDSGPEEQNIKIYLV